MDVGIQLAVVTRRREVGVAMRITGEEGQMLSGVFTLDRAEMLLEQLTNAVNRARAAQQQLVAPLVDSSRRH